jgi:hypothetical protein
MKNNHFIMFNARPHPNPLPRGEGIAVDPFIFCGRFTRRLPVSICRISGNVSSSSWGEISPKNSRMESLNPQRQILLGRGNPFLPLPGGEGRGEGGLYSNIVISVHDEGGRHI